MLSFETKKFDYFSFFCFDLKLSRFKNLKKGLTFMQYLQNVEDILKTATFHTFASYFL